MSEDVSAALRTFLHGETNAKTFHHRDHVEMAFEILSHHPNFVTAASAFSSSLRKIASRAGNASAYHETITLAFLSLIAERIAGSSARCFDAFATRNADLLDKEALSRWYSAERLARRPHDVRLARGEAIMNWAMTATASAGFFRCVRFSSCPHVR